MNFSRIIQLLSICLLVLSCSKSAALSNEKKDVKKDSLTFYPASNANFRFIGRTDFSDPLLPRFYAPGVYVQAAFKGTFCEVKLNDEELYGKSHNYISIVIDNGLPKRIKLKGKLNIIKAAENLEDKIHTITICKSTEAGIGYIEFAGLQCKELLPLPEKPVRKIEFIGNSITCGMGSDLTIPCGSTADWFDQHNAYLAYGPLTSRALNAQWQLTSVSGIGLIHSCCGMKLTMPEVFDKVNLRDNKTVWDFKKYQPDVVTVCLGQNDGKQDSAAFCSAYVNFIVKLRTVYPAASIVCLTSPMADASLAALMKNYLSGIVEYAQAQGDKNVSRYFFSKRYHKGCGDHPDLADHAEIVAELTAYIRKLKSW